jgi:hypothetical protein
MISVGNRVEDATMRRRGKGAVLAKEFDIWTRSWYCTVAWDDPKVTEDVALLSIRRVANG